MKRRKFLVETVAARCDCGTEHRIERGLVGTHQWWTCSRCLDRQSREFEARHPHLRARWHH